MTDAGTVRAGPRSTSPGSEPDEIGLIVDIQPKPVSRPLRAAMSVFPPLRDIVDERADLARQVAVLKDRRNKLRSRLGRVREDLSAAAETNGELVRQLAHASSDSHPDEDLKYLFVVTYGRSGSTLLQGLLNSIPGYLIRGENGGALYELFELHRGLTDRRTKHGPSAFPRDAWYGIGGYADELAYAALRRFVLTTLIRPDADARVVGFKEIRWRHDDLRAYVDFLRGVFPGARFIVNTRDHAHVVSSKWWSKQADAPEVIADTESRLLALADDLGAESFHLHYDDYADDPPRLEELFDWLQAPFDEQAVREVMEVRHSY